jgi:hypothetical protein
VTLAEAHEYRDEAQKPLSNGVDPGVARKVQKSAQLVLAANSFEAIVRERLEKWRTDKAESHSSKVIARLESDVFRGSAANRRTSPRPECRLSCAGSKAGV